MFDSTILTRTLGGRWHGRYGTAACPCCQPERRRDQNALTVSDSYDGRLLVHCKKTGCSFADILAAPGVRPGSYAPPDPAVLAHRRDEEHEQAAKKSRQARRCWDEAFPITGTLAERYLLNRYITCELRSTLRYHPEAWHGPSAKRHPAMIALVAGSENFAIHRTYLASDGRGKAAVKPDKMMLGATAGGAVRLTHGTGHLLIGEGIESTLSAFILHSDPTAIAWAALSTSGLRGLRLPNVGNAGTVGTSRPSLVIAVDGEKAGRDAGRDLAERAAGLGWHVGILDPGDRADFNDRLIEGARHEHV